MLFCFCRASKHPSYHKTNRGSIGGCYGDVIKLFKLLFVLFVFGIAIFIANIVFNYLGISMYALGVTVIAITLLLGRFFRPLYHTFKEDGIKEKCMHDFLQTIDAEILGVKEVFPQELL